MFFFFILFIYFILFFFILERGAAAQQPPSGFAPALLHAISLTKCFIQSGLAFLLSQTLSKASGITETTVKHYIQIHCDVILMLGG